MTIQAPPRPPSRPPGPGGPRRPSVAIDPRLRQRRIEVIREQGRRRLRILIAVVSVVVAVGLTWVVIESPMYDVDHIRVSGAVHTSTSAIDAASGIRRRDALLFADLGAATRGIEALPWVERAVVHKVFPGTVTIAVTERVPVAWVRTSPSSVALLDASGRVLGAEPVAPAGAIEVAGLGAIPTPGRSVANAFVVRALTRLRPSLSARVASATWAAGELTLHLAGGPEVRLGPPDQLDAKSDSAEVVLARSEAAHAAYVDVRVPAAPVTG
ncbi:MAG: ftsQ [Actinomycetia bacterium]|nr:ftsQ [Actinomycetes bacterium]